MHEYNKIIHDLHEHFGSMIRIYDKLFNQKRVMNMSVREDIRSIENHASEILAFGRSKTLTQTRWICR